MANVNYAAVTITTTATLIMDSFPNVKSRILVNNSSQTVYIGPDSSITTSNAIPIVAGATLFNSSIFEAFRGTIYGIVAATTADVRYWEWGQ